MRFPGSGTILHCHGHIWDAFHKNTYDKNHRKSISRNARHTFKIYFRIKIFAYLKNINHFKLYIEISVYLDNYLKNY